MDNHAMNELRPKGKVGPYAIVTGIALAFALLVGYTNIGGTIFLLALPCIMLYGLIEWLMRLRRTKEVEQSDRAPASGSRKTEL